MRSGQCCFLLLGLTLSMACDHGPAGPTAVLVPLALQPTPTATPPSSAFTGGVFKVAPSPGADGVIRGVAPLVVAFNMCPTVNPDPSRFELYFAEDFLGNGSETHAGTTGADCWQTHIYTSTAVARVCVVDRDRISRHELHQFACADFRVAPVVGAFCHPLIAAVAPFCVFPGSGDCYPKSVPVAVSCPTGATELCDSRPIVRTSSDQARLACESCGGPGRCSQTDFGGSGYAAWVFDTGRPHSYSSDYMYMDMWGGQSGQDLTGAVFSGPETGAPAPGRWAP
jgi:hypothetical protein